MFSPELEHIEKIARASRKDAVLYPPANEPDRPRKVYGDEKFTHEQAPYFDCPKFSREVHPRTGTLFRLSQVFPGL